MEEFIKEVINIHKCKFFFLIYAGLWAGPRDLRAYVGRTYAGLQVHYPGPTRIFSADLPVGLTGHP